MDITELLREHNVRTVVQRQGWVQTRCPFCQKDPYLGFNVRAAYCNCWNCGFHKLEETLSLLLRIPQRDAYQIASALRNGSRASSYGKHDPNHVLRGEYKPPSPLEPLGAAHRKYLIGRGFDPVEISRLWGIKGIGMFGRLKWRIFIPIHLNGEPVSWTTRRISNKEPRYHSTSPKEEKFSHKELLYGEDYCRGSVIVHEGPTDVWRTGPGAVATMGTGFSDAQVLRLSMYGLRIICFDNEPKAQKRARHLCSLLEGFPGETLNVVLDSKDPGSATSEEIAELRSLLK